MQTKLVFTLISLLSLSAIWGQTTTLYTGLNTAVGLEANGNDLYIAESQSNRIVKLDISNSSPSLQIVANTNSPEGLALDGNHLRIANLTGAIGTINVLAGIPSTVSTYHGTPGGVGARAITYNATHGLYIGTAYQGNSTRIYKINSASSATLITTIPGPFGTDVRGMAIIGNYLYATQRSQDRIYRIDLTQANPTPVVFKSGINMAYDLEADGNKLYITTEAGKLYRINDVTVNNPPLTTLISGGFGAFAGIEIIGQQIYIAGWANGGRILKYTDNTLSVNDDFKLETFSFYPNPTIDLLTIKLKEQLEKVVIYSIIGEKVIESNKTLVNVKNLSNGMYILKVYTNTGEIGVKRFIKE